MKLIQAVVTEQYILPAPDSDHLRAALTTLVNTALPNGATFNGSANLEQEQGIIVSHTAINSLADWLDVALEPGVTYASLSANSATDGMQLSVGARNLTLKLTAAPERVNDLSSMLAAFRQASGLPVLKSPVFLRPQTRSFRRSTAYRLLTPLNESSLTALLNSFDGWLTVPPANFSGSINWADKPDITEDIQNALAWRTAVLEHLPNVQSARYGPTADTRALTLDLQQAAGTLRLDASATDPASVADLYARLTSTLNVTLQNIATPEGLKRDTRQYFVKVAITPEWLDRALDLLAKYGADPRYFNGTLRDAGNNVGYQNLDLWKRELEAHWKTLQTATLSRGMNQDYQYLSLDFERQLLSLTLQSTPDTATERELAFATLQEELKLDPVQGRPYQYYRFARKYRNENEWNRTTDAKLADAINSAVAKAFPEGRYAFMGGSYSQGEKAEEQIVCDSAADFTRRLRDGIDYQTAQLSLQGPRGRDLFVKLDKPAKTVIVRSSIPDGSVFKEVIAKIDSIQDLTLSSKDDRPAAEVASKSDSAAFKWTQLIIPTVVSSVVALTTAFLTGSNGLPSLKSTLTIDAPTAPASGVAEIEGSVTPIYWSVTRRTLREGEKPEIVTATIDVAKQGTDSIEEYKGKHSGETIAFRTSGTYDVIVKPESGNANEQRIHARVTVPTPKP